MLRGLAFESYMPVAMFAICHFVGRWSAVFGLVVKNSHVYTVTFLGIVLLLGVLSMAGEKPATWRNRLAVAIVVPYISSVVASLISLVAFYLEHGNRGAFSPTEGIVVALFAPYIASAAWLISIYAIIWMTLQWYRASLAGKR